MTRLLPMASPERRLVDNTDHCNVWRFEEGGFPDVLIIFGAVSKNGGGEFRKGAAAPRSQAAAACRFRFGTSWSA
jgi:hypothetical protein